MHPVQPRVVVITGAGSGLGRAMALALARGGHALVLAGRRREALEETAALAAAAASEDTARAARDIDAATARDAGDPDATEPTDPNASEAGQILVVPTDVTVAGDADRLVEAAVTAYGQLDALINNAGTGVGGGTIDEIDDAAWEQAVAVNLTGYFRCARAAWRQMRAQNPSGGRIINNGSIAAQVPRVGGLAYATTKHAVSGLTKSLEIDGRGLGIRCTQIDIGNASTAMTARMGEGIAQPDGSRRVEPTFDPGHVGELVRYVVELPLDVTMPFATVAAAEMPWLARG